MPQRSPLKRDLDYESGLIRTDRRNPRDANDRACIVHPCSLAATKGILVSFYFCTALTNMLKFSALSRLAEAHCVVVVILTIGGCTPSRANTAYPVGTVHIYTLTST